MPTELENAKFMFQILQFSNATGFNYKAIGDACGISGGAASKRMNRLKQSVKDGKETGLDVRFLWSCIQNSDMGTINFQALGPELNVTAGTASKRWSRLKQALERGETGAPASAKGGGATAGKKATGAAASGGRKRKAAEGENDEGDGSSVKKEKIEVGDNDGAELTKPATGNQKPAVKKAATTGPKKAVSNDVREIKSTPPRPRSLTYEEIYDKLGVDEAEEDLKTDRKHAYPVHHNLLQTFQALQTPGRASAGASVFGFVAPQSEAVSYPTPEDNAQGPDKRTAYDVFTTIAEEAMRSPSGAERRLQREKEAIGEQPEWDNEVDRSAKMQNPFVSSGEDSFYDAAVNTSFFGTDEPGEDEDYC